MHRPIGRYRRSKPRKLLEITAAPFAKNFGPLSRKHLVKYLSPAIQQGHACLQMVKSRT